MRVVGRWGVAVAVSVAGFALGWWVCGKLIGLDEGVSLGVAGAVLAVLLAVAAWWVPLGADGSGSDGGGSDGGGSDGSGSDGSGSKGGGRRRLVQKVRAGRDANVAGGDQTVINYRGRDE
jgi:hypothetical protein